jgi:rhodanese-related sulfurtransferase
MDTKRQAAMSHYELLGRVAKALGSPARLRLLDLLRQGPRSVEVLAEEAGLNLKNASQHLQQLRAARLVETHKEGQRVVYRVAEAEVSSFFGALRELSEAILPEMDRLGRDLELLAPEQRDELLQRIKRDEVLLLDVRPAEEFAAGYLPGAISIPLPELPRRLREIPRRRDVVAYCRGPYCTLAQEAVVLLRKHGYHAEHLDLGIPDLRALRWRIERDATALAGGPVKSRSRRSR